MLATTSQFAAMLDGRVRQLAFTVQMDLPGGVFPDVSLAVTRLELDASVDTDMPEGTRLEEGFSSVQGTFTLAGRVDPADVTKTAAWLFGRYSVPAADGSYSPLRRSDVLYRQVTIKLGLYPEGSGGTPELLTKLVGLVEDYGRDSDGNVAFTVFDLRQQFRGAVDLPAVVTEPPFNAGLTNEFVVDRLLRQSTNGAISSWPAIRDDCILAVGLRGSIEPEVGKLDTTENQLAPTFRGSPDYIYGSGLIGVTVVTGFTSGVTKFIMDEPAGDDIYVEFLMDAPSGDALPLVQISADAANFISFGFGSSSGDLVVSAFVSGLALHEVSLGAPTARPGGGLAQVKYGFEIHWPVGSTSFTGTGYADGEVIGTATATAALARPDVDMQDAALATTFYTGQDPATLIATAGLQITNETDPSAHGVAFTPRAILDPSLNPLTVVAPISGDPWQAIQTLAASELAVAGFEGDTFYYRNRQTLRSSASVRTITSDQALTAIEESSSAAAIVNRAQIGWTPWTFASAATTLWSAAKAHRVPPNGTWSTIVTLPSLATQIDTVASILTDGSSDATHSYFRASTDKYGTDAAGGVTVTVEQIGGDKIKVTATNSKSTPAWLVSSADYTDVPVGTPLLRVAGIAVTSGDEQTTDYQWPPTSVTGSNGQTGAAGSRFGEILYQLTGNQWIQDEDAAQQLDFDVVSSGYVSRADLTNVGIAPDPRLQRSDRVLLTDTARTGINAYAQIFGYTITYEAPSEPDGSPTFEMTADARTIAPPEGWIGGVAGSSEGGQTTYGY